MKVGINNNMSSSHVKARHFQSGWVIEVDTKELGKVLVLDKETEYLSPIYFKSEEEANQYIKNYKKKIKENIKCNF